MRSNNDGMIEQLLQEKTSEVIKQLYGQDIPSASIGLEKTKKEIEGDYTIVVFSLSRISKKSPEATAQDIGTFLLADVEEVKEFKVIKGFLNVILKDEFWIGFMLQQYTNDVFGFREQRGENSVLLEYSSPNTNKPLHLGHIRNNLLGFSLSRILQAQGNKVIRMNLVNDRGIHICKSMLAYMKWGNNETPLSSGMKSDHLIGKYYVLFDRKFKEEIKELMEQGVSEEDASKNAPLIIEAQEILRKWEANDPDIRALWLQLNNWAFEGFTETYHKLGVSFDVIQHESETYLFGKELVMEGLSSGSLLQREDGSIWADLRDEGLDEKLLMRSDGTSVYMTQDLGTAALRYNEYKPSKMIYVVGNEQNYHFDVLRKVLKRLGRDWAEKIFHLSYGMVELPEGKMKSREGTVVDADELIGEMLATAEATTRELGKADEFSEEEASMLFRAIGLGALKYYILKVDPKKNMLFDPKESIDFNGNTGPFIQYTYARIRSLLRRAADSGYLPSDLVDTNLTLFPGEKGVIKLLAQFPAVVKQAGEEMSPAIIANYAYELAKEYNQFYQEIPVLKESDPAKVTLRLAISEMAGEVIKKSMALLGIIVPERM